MTAADKAAPMASAPIRYAPDGSVDWGTMWESFCALPRDGGPPHRPTLLLPDEDANQDSAAYQAVVAEIARGIGAVSGLTAAPGPPGWVAVACAQPGMARWLAEAIVEENVLARSEGGRLLLPAGAGYTLKGEIKNVITAVAKTTHYWSAHLPVEVKVALAVQERVASLWKRVARAPDSTRPAHVGPSR
jgi:sirohydrochlorin cobaltochelatase